MNASILGFESGKQIQENPLFHLVPSILPLNHANEVNKGEERIF